MELELYQLLFDKRKALVSKDNPDLGKCDIAEMSIRLKPDARPNHQKPYRLSPDKKKVLEHQLEHLLEQGIIAPLSGHEDIPITSSVVLVEKRTKSETKNTSEKDRSLRSYRFCVDFRFLNSQTEEFRYPIPDIQDSTESVNNSHPKFISCFDLISGFFQMKISESSSKYTAFDTHVGAFKFLRVHHEGIKTAPNYFAFCMDKLLKHPSLSNANVLCYIDDCVLFNHSLEVHLSDLRVLLDCFISARLKLNPEKCRFARDKCVFLGHEISADDALPSNQTDSSDRTDDNVDDPSVLLETRTKRLIESLNVFNSSSFSLATVSTLQKKDPDLSPIITYLENGTLPSSQKLSRQILLKQPHYSLIDGVLFHPCEPKTKRKFVSNDYTLVLPKVLQKPVIDMYHSSPLAAHAGITATLQRVKADFYFERMSVLISDFVKSCDLCQRRKIVRHNKSPVTAIPVPSKPFAVWEIDLFGPLTLTAQGNAYVFTAICTFSKFVHAVPLKSKDSISVSNAIFDLCTLYGVPDCLLSALGTEMTSVITKHVCQLLDVPQQFTPAFSHFVLGGIERVHRSMAEQLTPFLNNSKTNWDSVLSAITFPINISVHSTTGNSPFMVLYWQEPQFPLSASLSQNSLLSDTAEVRHYMNNQQKKLDMIRQYVKENIETMQARMCAKANLKIHPLTVQTGDYVYLNAECSGPARKFHYSYSGPFVIHEVKSNHIVVLCDPHRDKLFPNIHLNRCKKAYVRANNPSFVFSPDDFPPLVATRVEIPPVHNTPAISPDLSAGNPSHVPAEEGSEGGGGEAGEVRAGAAGECIGRDGVRVGRKGGGVGGRNGKWTKKWKRRGRRKKQEKVRQWTKKKEEREEDEHQEGGGGGARGAILAGKRKRGRGGEKGGGIGARGGTRVAEEGVRRAAEEVERELLFPIETLIKSFSEWSLNHLLICEGLYFQDIFTVI
ncbi:retrovirus-related pol polyprotein from transposon [Plakobranchus ocellatus]|uniref:Retrovirus-related pol polyprotein from transposon n=1 Tax=Plakobranchus ocellatus TaxID=259542 RepID=A0AAV4C8Y2_9GAST|nr:retrovirus-related pol polyprotein from transposon [Plakobranchus ocellatus]